MHNLQLGVLIVHRDFHDCVSHRINPDEMLALRMSARHALKNHPHPIGISVAFAFDSKWV